MKAAIAFVLALAGGMLLAPVLRPGSGDRLFVSSDENVMGTSMQVKVQAESDAAAGLAERAVRDEISRLSNVLSSYDPASEFSRWMQSAAVPTKVSPELIDVLSAFDEWRARTSGALDPSAEAIATVWTRAARERRLPTNPELQAALDQVRRRHWVVDRPASAITRTSDVPLRLNSFTKSYIVDRAARRALAVRGVTGVLIDAGGDVVVRGAWTQTVGVADPAANADNATPLTTLAVRDAVVATSGGNKRGFDIGGRHYSHVVDPRTAWPTGHVLSATVVSSDAIEAGALATAFCVLTPEDSAALARTRPGVEFALVLAGGRRVESPGWRGLEARPQPRPSFPSPIQALYAAGRTDANPGPRLTIDLELARLDAMGRRPYVAVWIDDGDRFPVRTVALWYDGKARWLPELRAWYRADRLRAMAEGTQIADAVTSATRQAGKYTLQWDGRDNAGKPVPAGKYIVCIEASREHGTYQIIRQEIDLSGAPRRVALPGGTEISAANLDVQPAGRR